ncbi:MAG: TlpA family protein disulfide reductase [Candidatus Hydrogenedentes bacterium]|nr:TlpA family protein disulfide reductase [Candidatus Hydrogenedentota bacterium]
MTFADSLRHVGLGIMVCAAAIVPALTMGRRAAVSPLRVGDVAPQPCLSDWLQGIPIDFDAPHGVTVLVFWGTYCPPCRDAMPVLSRAQERYAKDGVRVVCVGHESREKTAAYLGRFSPPLRQSFALDSGWITSRLYLEGLDVFGIPLAVVVAPDGTIAWHGDPLDEGLIAAIQGSLDSSSARKLQIRLR